MSENTQIQVAPQGALQTQGDSLSVQEVRSQVNLIQSLMRDMMKDGEHFGKIPGCGDKPTLLKAGAEKLAFIFRLAPEYTVNERQLANDHREYQIICTLFSTKTGVKLGSGLGSCTTMETKYRYRKAEQTCPKCGKPTIIKGKKEYGGGWLCYAKKGGCGAKFNDGDAEIENQNMGRIEHDNPADYYNTVLKMGKKRALVDAVLTTTAASDIFTQDVEDMAANSSFGPTAAAAVQQPEVEPEGGSFENAKARAMPANTVATPHAPKPVTSGEQTVKGVKVKAVRTASGTGASGKAWNAWFVTFHDGTEAGTFSKTVGELSETMAGRDETCTVRVKPGKKTGTLELVDLEPEIDIVP